MRACNRCKKDVAGDYLAFEGEFLDWNYQLDLCESCARSFKPIVEQFCKDYVNTDESLSKEEKAEREPVSKAAKRIRAKKECKECFEVI